MTRTRWGWVAIAAGLLIVLVWLLPIQGRLILQTGNAPTTTLYPYIVIEPANPIPGSEVVTVTDEGSWAYVKLTSNGLPATFVDWEEVQPGQLWRWQWRMRVPFNIEDMTSRWGRGAAPRDCTRRMGWRTGRFSCLSRVDYRD